MTSRTLTVDGDVHPGAVRVAVVVSVDEDDVALVPAGVRRVYVGELDGGGGGEQRDAPLVGGGHVGGVAVKLDEERHLGALAPPLHHVLGPLAAWEVDPAGELTRAPDGGDDARRRVTTCETGSTDTWTGGREDGERADGGRMGGGRTEGGWAEGGRREDGKAKDELVDRQTDGRMDRWKTNEKSSWYRPTSHISIKYK